jgi:hypothetical protein
LQIKTAQLTMDEIEVAGPALEEDIEPAFMVFLK